MTNRSSFHSNDYHPDPYWDVLRNRNFDASFPAAESWIRKNEKNIIQARVKKRRMRKRVRLSLFSLLAALIVFTFLYKTEKVEKFGDLFSFRIDKNNTALIKQLNSLQQLLKFNYFEFTTKDHPSMSSYISIVTNKQSTTKISQKLKALKGVTGLEVNAIEYRVKESLFLTFIHKTLHIKISNTKSQNEELEKNIQTKLRNKGIDFVSVKIANNRESPVIFIKAKGIDSTINKEQLLDSVRGDKQLFPGTIDNATRQNTLEKFNWLLGAWKVKNVPNETWHYWLRVNDSLLKCVVIEVTGDEKTNKSVGFSIRLTAGGEDILSLKGSQWKFMNAISEQFVFRNDMESNPDVKWILKDGYKTWQSIISAEGNAEFINLTKEENSRFEKSIKDFNKQQPNIYK